MIVSNVKIVNPENDSIVKQNLYVGIINFCDDKETSTEYDLIGLLLIHFL